jgi:hypothetical protein
MIMTKKSPVPVHRVSSWPGITSGKVTLSPEIVDSWTATIEEAGDDVDERVTRTSPE